VSKSSQTIVANIACLGKRIADVEMAKLKRPHTFTRPTSVSTCVSCACGLHAGDRCGVDTGLPFDLAAFV